MQIKSLIKTFLGIVASSLLVSCCQEPGFNVLPYPQSVVLEKGSFRADGATVINFDSESKTVAEAFSDALNAAGKKSGKFIALETAAGDTTVTVQGPAIYFMREDSLAFEAYTLEIGRKHIYVKASSKPGYFYAVQTLKQMMPARIFAKSGSKEKLCVRRARIEDKPMFGYRGMMLDCSRHFFSLDEVKRFIDIISVYKCNRFHWHLTDDQGWRVEISKYPRLTEVGAFRDSTIIKRGPEYDHTRYGGFYTKDELKDVVAYAAERCITIIPEIDMPGHMQAALASYPELGCTGGPYAVRSQWGISRQVLCPGKPETIQFMKDVLTELAEIFPSEYIHIGGDECPKEEWKESKECQALIKKLGLKDDEESTAEQHLQSWLTCQLQDHLTSLGKKIIGWDEVIEGKLKPGVTVMSWRGTAGGEKAVRKGMDVIFSPTTYCYFDYAQSPDLENEPYSITRILRRRILPLYKTYSFDPLDRIPAELQSHILGVQANVWTEYIATPEHLEYMFLPRLAVISEIQWSALGSRSYHRLINSISDQHFKMYDAMGLNYRKNLDI